MILNRFILSNLVFWNVSLLITFRKHSSYKLCVHNQGEKIFLIFFVFYIIWNSLVPLFENQVKYIYGNYMFVDQQINIFHNWVNGLADNH